MSDTLRSFIRWSSNAQTLTLQCEFEWPSTLAPLSRRFAGYTWGKPLDPQDRRVYGICPLGFRWPASLPDVETAIFSPLTVEPATHGEDLDHYLIVELFDPHAARALLAMLVSSRDWYLLDEHRLYFNNPT